jgi:EAL domain-containing protein (putative c-di-GMP-specific phosphodiesterase class I)
MAGALVERKRLERELRGALERDQLVLHYQPQIELPSGRLIGVEALLRWRHPERGMLLPDEFIQAAEVSGLWLPLGEWVLREACRQGAAWRDAGLGITVAVNVALGQLRRRELLRSVASALEESRLEPHRLEIEIAEEILSFSGEASIDGLLGDLGELGVGLVVDGFGAGPGSLAGVRRQPARKVKIAHRLIRGLGDDRVDEALVRAIICLGRGLGMHVVAEGVERPVQRVVLRELGCDAAQGHLLGRPGPPGLIDLAFPPPDTARPRVHPRQRPLLPAAVMAPAALVAI